VNEAPLNTFGYGTANPEGARFAGKVLTHMRERLVEFQEEKGNLYNLEATPAEEQAAGSQGIDKRKHLDIVVANEKQLKDEAAFPGEAEKECFAVKWTRTASGRTP
jgi:ribonucleoside-triphosphate reductase